MRVYLFQDKFADKVRDGSKPNTIRATARCKPGDMLSLRRWTGKPYRSKQEVLREVVCKSVDKVRIATGGVFFPHLGHGYMYDSPAADEFAKRDGFVDFVAMLTWFEKTHGLPFYGYLITWEAIRGEQ